MEEVNVKIYVAGASSEIERAASAIAWAGAQGLQVTHDWTVNVPKVLSLQSLKDPKLIVEGRRHYADLDFAGIRNAYLFWLLVPSEGHSTAGAWVEFGLALAYCTTTIVSGGTAPSIFTSLAAARVATDEEAKEKIMHMARYLSCTPKP